MVYDINDEVNEIVQEQYEKAPKIVIEWDDDDNLDVSFEGMDSAEEGKLDDQTRMLAFTQGGFVLLLMISSEDDLDAQ